MPAKLPNAAENLQVWSSCMEGVQYLNK